MKEDDDMTEETDRKVKMEEPQSDNRSGDLRQHSMIYICVLISLLAVLGLLVYWHVNAAADISVHNIT